MRYSTYHLSHKLSLVMATSAALLTLAPATAEANHCMAGKGYRSGYHGQAYQHPGYGMMPHSRSGMYYHPPGYGGPHHYSPGYEGKMKRPQHYGMYDGGKAGSEKAYPGGYGQTEQSAQKDIVETAVATGKFQTLVKALNAASLTNVLSQSGSFTVFAPTDEAFSKLPEGTLEKLLNDPDKLRETLQYHVVEGSLSAADILKEGELKTLQGGALSLSDLEVAQADIPASNGVIHIIDTVLTPKL